MRLPNIFQREVTPFSVSAGKAIYSEGEPATAMYVVQSGEVELKFQGQSIEVLGPDGFFGEMALIDHGNRRATAVAKTDCVIIPVSERHFLFMVEETPFFALTVMRTMVVRLRRGVDVLKE